MPVTMPCPARFPLAFGFHSQTFGLHQQKVRADLQPGGDSLDIVDRNIALAALNPAEIGAIHLDIIGEDLLADTKGFPVSADIRCNGST
jgi:hypothetical protein